MLSSSLWRDENCLVVDINHHAGLGALGLGNIADLGVIHRHLGGILGPAVKGGQLGRFLHRNFGGLFSLGDKHRVGAGDVFGVEPNIVVLAVFKVSRSFCRLFRPTRTVKPSEVVTSWGADSGGLFFFAAKLFQIALLLQLRTDFRQVLLGFGRAKASRTVSR